MLLDYYNLQEQPFGVTPDPRYLYMSVSHREALASLSYGIRSGRGFMSLIAKPGMGKTTTLFRLLGELKDSARTVFLFQTFCSPQELLRAVLHDLGVARVGTSMERMQEQLNRLLAAESRQDRKVVVVIDEAQNLEDSSLELLRMLSNFETASDKMMQIVLAGQPQLREKLASPHLLQLRQRMSIFSRLDPFDARETHLYIDHRLRVAGYNSRAPLFTPQAEALIAKYGEGIPRNINNICFNALSLGWVSKQRTISKETITEVLRDLDRMPEATSESQTEPSRPFIDGRGSKSHAVFQQTFAWRKRLAVLGILLLPLIWFLTPGQRARANGPASLPTMSAASQPVRPFAFQNAVDANSGVALQSGPAPVLHDAGSGVSQHHARRTPESQSTSQPDLPAASEVDQLWQKVKKEHRSDAEVKLARIYLEGTVVPRNCAQAQVLLMAASRKGNAHAAELLNDFLGLCHRTE